MAYCRECLGPIGTDALTCPHCGVPHPLAEPSAPKGNLIAHEGERLPTRSGRRLKGGGLAGGAVVLVGTALLVLFAVRAFGPANVASRADSPSAAAVDGPTQAGGAQRGGVTPALQPMREPDGRPWYIGGTLHKATLGQWRVATSRNRLATAADFIAASNLNLRASEVLPQATALVTCIDRTVLDGRNVDDRPVSEIAAPCLVLTK